VALVAAMASSLKSWGTLLLLLGLQCSLLAQSTSRRAFMEYHHLNPNRAFSAYRCDEVVKEKRLMRRISYTFLHMSRYELEQVCISGNLTDRLKNSYFWTRVRIKVLQCSWVRYTYKDTKSYNHVLFHCGDEGYVDRIEDVTVLEPIFD
uniref:Uncharacterized protein n=1 Tax=Peromyscus maniculatus bairdii TaxID=230844 RepID=A0A8C8ULE0_PERMB